MSEYQIGDIVRVVQITWLEDDDTAEFAKAMRDRIGCVGRVIEAKEFHDWRTVIIEMIDGYKPLVLLKFEEIELVHRPAPIAQIPLLEVES